MNHSQQSKRKFPFSGLQRRVRARKDEPEPDFAEDYESESSQDGNQDDDDDASDDSQDQDGASLSGSAMNEDGQSQDEDDEDDSDDGEPSNPSLAASQISFGALAKAQASLPAVSRRKHKKPGDEESGDDSDSDSSPEEFDRHGKSKIKPVAGRAHKHAPAEMTSKKPVTRRRQVVDVASASKPAARDPRFGPPLHSTAADAERAQDALRRNYAFLGSYRDSEMAALRTRIKKTKDPFEKQRLERELASMQSRKQAQERRDAEHRVIDEHRKKEKELVRQGVKSQPFYLKKSEQRKRVFTERFQGMKKRQVDKAIVRRRKKDVAKERKELPMERRAR
ncbi:hypothetical protein PFICI_10929 [Pestalotiopsis fici W106-1]|uniref:rRNA biogenesis protein RRP36 n=1 Tax=Pestalotiopsis fici (strain W106-1 / CGMCC3.15140) TaxID=1229662 RepID=W3WT75_PESFW|nr:uncharacterized protein PFICI_10929 [Pestalotiopsis fici W106-1]ETS77055.1 hypothetical protein PFICI_10929 [Pestalotiopsis fici W106-1]